MSVNGSPALRLISIPVSPYCELGRWALDRLGLSYTEEAHAPVLHLLSNRLHGGGSDVPVLPVAGTTLVNARQVLDWVDAQTPPEARLFPTSPDARPLFESLYSGVGVAARAWAYAYMLPIRASAIRAWSAGGVSRFEQLLVRLLFPLLAALVRRSLGIGPDTIAQRRAEIDAAFAQVEALLADGRHYLLGDRFTAADMAFASLAAPTILPDEYQGPLPHMDELPPPMRADVERYRASVAGQFALRIYREERARGVPRQSPGDTAPRSIRDTLVNTLTGPEFLRPVFVVLRRIAPILVVGKRGLVTRYTDVVEVFTRDDDFVIGPINAPRFEELHAPFILGMDRSPQLEREQGILEMVLRRDDLPRIRQFVVESAAELVDAAQQRGRIDVVSDLTRVVPVRLLGWYFGIPGPDETTMQRWMRVCFHQAFLNVTNNAEVRYRALQAADGLRDSMRAEIVRRKALVGTPGQPDDILARLLALQDESRPWLDDETIRRNLAGLVLGAVDTTSKFTTLALDELLRRPDALRAARAAALGNDLETVRRYAWEAVRFNPHHSFQVRQAARDCVLAAGTARARRIPAGATVLLATLSAMFDPDAIVQPDAFRTDRSVEYLHFGVGLHACLGRSINAVQVPELLAALLRLPGLRRAPGHAGEVVYDGPFPDRLLVDVEAAR